MKTREQGSHMQYTTRQIHINDLRVGDTVLHDGHLVTVGNSNLKRGGFMGTTLMGDCYRLGTLLVTLVQFNSPRGTVRLAI